MWQLELAVLYISMALILLFPVGVLLSIVLLCTKSRFKIVAATATVGLVTVYIQLAGVSLMVSPDTWYTPVMSQSENAGRGQEDDGQSIQASDGEVLPEAFLSAFSEKYGTPRSLTVSLYKAVGELDTRSGAVYELRQLQEFREYSVWRYGKVYAATVGTADIRIYEYNGEVEYIRMAQGRFLYRKAIQK